ncbi:MAG: hypothetical protein Q4G45_10660 [Actinomycetia bacterium]|nr:hypothetical protein [Actinomycetes bacterium]
MPDLTVDPADLERAAQELEAIQGRSEQVLARLGELTIPDGTFGRVPWLSDQLRKPYADHAQACTECVADITESMGDLAGAVRTTSSEYRKTDQASAAAAGTVHS